MKVRKLLSALVAGLMLLGTMNVPAFADGTDVPMTFEDFVFAIETAGSVGADGHRTTVTWSPKTGCYDEREGHTCTVENVPATAATPKRVNAGLAQFQFAENATDIKIVNVDFKYEAADFTVCENSGWAGPFTAAQAPTAQLHLYNTGNVTVSGCTFDNVVLTPWNYDKKAEADRTIEIEDCTFKNIADSYGIKDVQASNISITNNTFESTRSGIMLSGATAKNVTISNNIFTCNETKGDLIQIASSFLFDDSSNMSVAHNESTNNTGLFRIMNKNVKNLTVSDNTLPAGTSYTSYNSKYDAEIAEDGSLTAKGWDGPEGTTVEYNGNYFATLQEALKAVYMSNPTDVAVLNCKEGAEVGKLSHGHVADDLIINGNGAKIVPGGDQDLEVDTYKYSRTTGDQDATSGVYLDKEISITVNNLGGIAVWGQRNTDYTVNITLNNCINVNRVYISGTAGSNNITLNNCSFDGKSGSSNPNTSVYSNNPGTINVTDCTFKDIQLALNFNNKTTGTQTINVDNCTVTDCAIRNTWTDFSAPLRFVTSNAEAKIDVNLTDVAISYSEDASNVGNGDILLGDGREDQKSYPGVTVNTTGVDAEVQMQSPGMPSMTVNQTVKADTPSTLTQPAAAAIGSTKFSTLADAVAAAKENETIQVFEGTYDEALTLSKKGIIFEGATDADGNPLVTITKKMIIKGQDITLKNIKLDVAYYDGAVIDGNGSKNAVLEGVIINGHNNRHGIYLLSNGTVKNSTINDCFMGIYNESNSSFTVDGLTSKGCTYGLQLVPYGADNVITIKNSTIDCSWANSIGGYGEGKNATLVAENNVFKSTSPYYQEEGAYGINTFLADSTVTNNVFEKNASILIRRDAGASNVIKPNLAKNYFENPLQAIHSESENVAAGDIFPVYTDRAKTTLSNLIFADTASAGNIKVSVANLNTLAEEADVVNNAEFAVVAENTTPPVPVTLAAGEKVSYADISLTKNGSQIGTNGKKMNVFITLNANADIKSVKHWNGTAWEDVSIFYYTGGGEWKIPAASDTIADTRAVAFDTSSFSPFAVIYTSTGVVDPATEITLGFEKVKDNEYNIVLSSDKEINRFMSAELAFEYAPTTGDISYTITGVGDVNVIAPDVSGKEAYEFNLNGKTADMTGTKLVIGKVKFTGYGKGSFNTTGTTVNVVNTAKAADNIVDTFVVGGGTGVGTLILPANQTDIDISVPKQKLTVNVAFNNAIKDNAAAYQDMTVTVNGSNLAAPIVTNLGTGVAFDATHSVYTVTIADQLTKNSAYTVTVEGAGYRTARYTVTMTADKTLNFWNNVKDTAIAIEEGNATASKVTKNFLAGDIVKDGKINVYDLSAVVSYFGTTNATGAVSPNAKYDLNRDGVIDSKDVAYVLVSWGE